MSNTNIKNLLVDENGNIYKNVVWSLQDQNWSPVTTAIRKRTEVKYSNGTFQRCKKGDIIISAHLDKENAPVITLSEVDITHYPDVDLVEPVPLNTDSNTRQLLKNIPISLWEWLEDLDTGSNPFLPSGIGWDGTRTSYDVRKRDNLRALFYGVSNTELVDRLVNAGQYTPFQNIPNYWKNATKISSSEISKIKWTKTANSFMVFAIWWDKHGNTYEVYHEHDKTLPELVIPDYAVKVIVGNLILAPGATNENATWSLYTI